MYLIFLPLLLAQQSGGAPWKVLIITGLLLVAGVVLTVYFFRRFRKSEAETEEDWSLSRSTLLGVAQPIRPPVATREAEQPEAAPTDGSREVEALANLRPSAELKEEQPAAEHKPEPVPASVVEPPSPPEPLRRAEEVVEHTGGIADAAVPAVEARGPEQQHQHTTDSIPAAPSEIPSIGAHTIAPPGVTDEEYHKSLQHSPFEEEVWADLEEREVPHARGEARIARTQREPFEPPRIEPLAPRDKPAAAPTRDDTGAVQSRRGSPAALRAVPLEPPERKRPSEQLAEMPAARVSPAALQTSARTGLSQPAGSILGLPAEATSGPLVLGEPRRSDESDIGTLTNYGKESDDGAGHGGTIALAVVILIIAGVLLVYLFVPSVHSSINGMVARAKGTNQEEAPKAQVFKATYDPTKTPIEATGTVQNISQDTLTDLSVEIKLERRGGGETDTKLVPVTPSEIAPGTQGTFQFELDGKQYGRFGVSRLLGKNGAEVKFVKPEQEK